MIKLGATPVRFVRSLGLLYSVFLLAGCAFWKSGESEKPPQQVLRQLPLQFNAQDKSQWQAMRLPGKLLTAYRVDKQGAKNALLAEAASSASMLRQALHIPPSQLGALQFDWRVDQLIAAADMRQRETEDSPVRLILVFEGDRQRFSTQNQLLSELTLSLTGEPLPYATLMYVWCNDCPAESVIVNPRTDRIRKMAVESGAERVGQWLRYRRDIRTDFEKAFGEPPGALIGLAIMTDTDNTRTSTRAWYGPVRLE
jgi:hypothetical protein